MTEAPSVGQLIRKAREAKGLSREKLAMELKHPLRHLEAIEGDDGAALPPGRPRPLARQLAAYVLYENPLPMLADSPSAYEGKPALRFVREVPVVWDETKVLDAKIAEYVVVARRNGRDWYIGAMTNWTPRDLEIDLSFLPAGTLRMEAYQDGVNAGRMAGDYKLVKSQVNRNARMKIHLAEGGGWAARIHP